MLSTNAVDGLKLANDFTYLDSQTAPSGSIEQEIKRLIAISRTWPASMSMGFSWDPYGFCKFLTSPIWEYEFYCGYMWEFWQDASLSWISSFSSPSLSWNQAEVLKMHFLLVLPLQRRDLDYHRGSTQDDWQMIQHTVPQEYPTDSQHGPYQ